MLRSRSRLAAIALAVAIVLVTALGSSFAGQARASTTQIAILQDDPPLLSDPAGTLARMRQLGVGTVRVLVRWQNVAPSAGSYRRPRRFDATNPGAYPAGNWAPYDNLLTNAQQDGIAIDFDLAGGSPLWATGPGAPRGQRHFNWEPSPSEFGSFVRAAGKRYSGSYTPRGASGPLPAVHFWSIWNEPDYGPSLAPQGTPGNLLVENSPWMYRRLVDAAWSSLQGTGHAHDTILIGELAPRGVSQWGVFSGMKPLIFLRALYCLDGSYRELRGRAATLRGCPATAAGARGFSARHPGLFRASGFSDHPYMRWYPPNREAQPDPDFTSLGLIGQLVRALDRAQLVYGSDPRFPIYSTEFGYLTDPPKHSTASAPEVSPTAAGYYLNWAEYLSWRNPRIASYAQYLLQDALPALRSNQYGGFASGLVAFNGKNKADYYAYRVPIYLPVTTVRRPHTLEVWGCARPRPAHFTILDSGDQTVAIEFKPSSAGRFQTLRTVPFPSSSCYFDTRVAFPSSGTVRLAWAPPTVPSQSNPPAPPQGTFYSRTVQVTVH